MKNPFVFGGVVSGEAFCDREEELAELLRAVQNGQNVVLHSPRRFGKCGPAGAGYSLERQLYVLRTHRGADFPRARTKTCTLI